MANVAGVVNGCRGGCHRPRALAQPVQAPAGELTRCRILSAYCHDHDGMRASQDSQPAPISWQ